MNPSSPWKNGKVWLLLAAIFVVGLLCGAVVTTGVLAKVAVKVLSMEGWSGRTVRDLKRDLKLTPEQAGKVREITDRHQPRMVAIRNETFYKLGREQKLLQEEIMPLLTPAQVEQWRALNARQDAKFKRTFKMDTTNAPAAKP